MEFNLTNWNLLLQMSKSTDYFRFLWYTQGNHTGRKHRFEKLPKKQEYDYAYFGH